MWKKVNIKNIFMQFYSWLNVNVCVKKLKFDEINYVRLEIHLSQKKHIDILNIFKKYFLS